MASFFATASALERLSPVTMTIADFLTVQLFDRFSGGVFYRIGHSDEPGGFAIDGDEHHGLSIGLKRGGAIFQIGRGNRKLGKQSAIAKRRFSAVRRRR